MGQRISAVHGVRSENYYEPGNAVNEIWIGNLEIISRLPFGDSDMAQAAWPEGDWPKIPWRPFIIPLKQNTVEARSTDVELCEDKACACLRWGGAFSGISPEASFTVALCLCFIVVLAFGVPIKLGELTRRSSGGTRADVVARKKWCRDCLLISFGCLIFGMILTVLDCEALAAAQFCREPNDAAIISALPGWWLFNFIWGIVVALMEVLCLRQVFLLFKEYRDLRWGKGNGNLSSTASGPGPDSRSAQGAHQMPDDAPISYELDQLQFSGTIRTLDQLSPPIQNTSRTTTNKGSGIPDHNASDSNLLGGPPEK